MSVRISRLSDVHPSARLGRDVEIGPFCMVGPDVEIGDACKLDSHVAIVGKTKIGMGNRFFANCVIGGEPQDVSYRETQTELVIGDRNQFREGVTISRGAEKEDRTTRVGNDNLLMANSHVAHNCRVYNNVILVNGVLLGGHVHVHDRAIVSGNTAVHHFCTVGRLAFVSGVGRVMRDVPPFMLAAGNEHQRIVTINLVGLRRAKISEPTIAIIKQAFRLLYRKNLRVDDVRERMMAELGGVVPLELTELLRSVELQHLGRVGRAREAVRDQPKPDSLPETPGTEQRRAA
ncbi:MAG: acyl-ACP--UDP-N-acetylglucosamine O-acyltransferase [Planctomycetota bacterium]|nr:acyl-ACP--UDP-N-acetylglucosamine O-acyltransferase [Planctomycetota bacterium]